MRAGWIGNGGELEGATGKCPCACALVLALVLKVTGTKHRKRCGYGATDSLLHDWGGEAEVAAPSDRIVRSVRRGVEVVGR